MTACVQISHTHDGKWRGGIEMGREDAKKERETTGCTKRRKIAVGSCAH